MKVQNVAVDLIYFLLLEQVWYINVTYVMYFEIIRNGVQSVHIFKVKTYSYMYISKVNRHKLCFNIYAEKQ